MGGACKGAQRVQAAPEDSSSDSTRSPRAAGEIPKLPPSHVQGNGIASFPLVATGDTSAPGGKRQAEGGGLGGLLLLLRRIWFRRKRRVLTEYAICECAYRHQGLNDELSSGAGAVMGFDRDRMLVSVSEWGPGRHDVYQRRSWNYSPGIGRVPQSSVAGAIAALH